MVYKRPALLHLHHYCHKKVIKVFQDIDLSQLVFYIIIYCRNVKVMSKVKNKMIP